MYLIIYNNNNFCIKMRKILLILGLTVASVLASDYATNHPDETL